MNVGRHFPSATATTAIMEASSRCVTTSSLMGSLALQARLSPPRTYVMTSKSTLVTPFMEGRTNSKVPLQRTRGDEGGYPHKIPMDSGGGQYLRHLCREYRSHLLSGQNPKKFLETAEKEKKKKYIDAFLKRRQHFTPLVDSVDRLLGVEAEVTLKRIFSRLAKNRKEPYSRTCRYVNSRFAITLVRATHRCIQGDRVPDFQISMKRPQ